MAAWWGRAKGGTMDLDSLTDLETRGYVVVRSFLAAEELDALRADAATAPRDGNANYAVRTPSAAALGPVMRRVDEVVAAVRDRTTLDADLPVGAAYFATGVADGVDFPWHQDHESWFQVQNHHDYLNFYVPIVKPDVARSNLGVVPFDALARRCPRGHRVLAGGGARHFVRLGRAGCLAVDDDRGTVRLIRGGIEALSETPELAAGDLLLMRGDVVHRTQDTETARIALSVRMASGATVVRRDRLVGGGLLKAGLLSGNQVPTRALLRVFDDAGRDAMPLREVRARVDETGASVHAVRRRRFLLDLLREKRRTGQLLRFALDVPVAAGLLVLTRAQQRRRGRHSGHVAPGVTP